MSEDQVTHTPTPWNLRRREDTEVLGLSKSEDGRNFYILHVAGNSHAPRAIADAEFAHTAINSYYALTARVAELDVEIAKLRTALIVVRAAIIRAPNDIITDTVWMPEEISMNETVVDFIDATLEPEA